ncbi:MAG: hypothetical protein U5J95_09020 [Balneolaceae bacterium]|nr:hypothetical protein [Balneolaceae bacterium]
MKKLLIVLGFLLVGSSSTYAQSPPQGLAEIDAYSIFYENYRSNAYEEAIKFGRWIWKGMPKEIEGYSRFDLATNLDRLTKVYTKYAQSLEDPSLRTAYLDTTQIIYQKAFDNLSDEINLYDWHFNRGRFYQQNANYIDNGMSKAVADYKRAFEENPEKLTNQSNGYYLKILLQHMSSQGSNDEALAIIEEAAQYDDGTLSEFFDDMRSDLFESNEERITFYEGKLEENPEDTEALNKLRNLYEEEEMIEKAQEVNMKLYELNPNLENTRALARFAVKNANYADAVKYLKEALDKADDANIKAEISLELAGAYLNRENLQQARRYARQAADLRSGWGAPYIMIGDIYAEAVNSCTRGRKIERSDRAVYWLAVDYYNKAKNVDSSSTGNADRKINAYKPVLPTAEDIHFTSAWTEGESLRIDSSINSCYSWIKESTTVR